MLVISVVMRVVGTRPVGQEQVVLAGGQRACQERRGLVVALLVPGQRAPVPIDEGTVARASRPRRLCGLTRRRPGRVACLPRPRPVVSALGSAVTGCRDSTPEVNQCRRTGGITRNVCRPSATRRPTRSSTS